MRYFAEATDTFGGEPNYCWVKRAEFDAPPTASALMLLRRAKRALDIADPMHTTHDWGDGIRADSDWSCICMFVQAAD